MGLPANLEAKREEMIKAEQAANTEPGVPAQVTNAEQVTISKAEFDKLRESADKVAAAEGRASALADDLSALAQRLTDLEKAPKSIDTPPASPPTPAPPAFVEESISEDELKEFDKDSVALMEKLANNAVARKMTPVMARVEAALKELESKVQSASEGVHRVAKDSFVGKVEDKISALGIPVSELVNRPEWQKFLQSKDEASGLAYGDIALKHNNEENVEGMANLLRTFHKAHVAPPAATGQSTGYESAIPSGATATLAPVGGKEVLKLSDRKAAHKKYIEKEISYDQYTEIKNKFDIADAEGRINYNS